MNFTIILGWMAMLGVPSIFAVALWCVKTCSGYSKQFIILMKAQKAQMRSQLLKDYYEYSRRGWLLQAEQDEWQNQYKAYHELVGDNGVLDSKKDILMNSMRVYESVDQAVAAGATNPSQPSN